MSPHELTPAQIREAACRALGEDIGPADITTTALVAESSQSQARLFVKESGILAGIPLAIRVFNELSPSLKSTTLHQDSDLLQSGATVLELSGSTRAILSGERSALNFLQHLSGIATETRRYVDAVAHTKCLILDTRKTIPGLRHLQKYAVRCGGGTNHRFGLYDAFMAKDNHVAIQNSPLGLRDAVLKMRAFDPDAPLIFEADTLEQVALLAGLNVNQILLDNMTCETMRQAVQVAQGRCLLEASGNMNLNRVREVAETGVDFISVGALTHSVRALDFSLEITTTKEVA
ncbi:MAG: carboxylating nicotinate-nucleotide diphosphorylase [Blastochloris sp.]|nr:carboxylating nicotinate-nucleotide diphosphorylase [Blastochloris sp.]